jgi:superfamily II DNA or RNA helicase
MSRCWLGMRERPSPPPLFPHQETAVQAVLRSLELFSGVLLADDVGLGKSWVAAAVASQLTSEIPRQIFVVPAQLVGQWQSLARDFGIDPEIVSHESLLTRLIVPEPDERRLIVVDEAHRFRNPSTKRYHALARLAIGARLMLITATPFCNSGRDLLALVRLFAADDAFAGFGFDSLEEAMESAAKGRELLRRVMVRRDRTVAGEHYPRVRRLLARYRVVSDLSLETALLALSHPLVPRSALGLMRAFLVRRLSSSVAALQQSVERLRRFYARAIEAGTRGVEISRRDCRRIFGSDEDAVVFQDILFASHWQLAPARASLGGLRTEITSLQRLLEVLHRARDSKLELLIRRLASLRRPAILFTESVATAAYLFGKLRFIFRAAILTAAMARDQRGTRRDRESLIQSFMAGEIEMLVCSDVAAEGLNLQHAAAVVQYDLPWTAVKIEQRLGRAWRLGSLRDEIDALFFVPDRQQQTLLEALRRKSREGAGYVSSAAPFTEPFDDARASSRPSLPPRLSRSEPQWRLLQRLLRRGGVVEAGLAALLGDRYPAGAEMLIDEYCREYLDPNRLAALAGLLRVEARRRPGAQRGDWNEGKPCASTVEA